MSTIFSVLFLLAVIGLGILGVKLRSPEHKGKVGEANVDKELQRLPQKYHVFNDVVIKTERGTTQVDHIVVSKYGIFAIETKNYRGEIYGDDARKQWTQIIATDVTYARKWYKTYTYVTKNHFYNPVKQAKGHAAEISKHLQAYPRLKVVPIVVFAGDASLAGVNSSYHVIQLRILNDVIMRYSTPCINDEELDDVVSRIGELNVRASVDNRTHVRNIKNADRERNLKISSGICPWCGGKLVKRDGKYGTFYGCSNYPKCKFTCQHLI